MQSELETVQPERRKHSENQTFIGIVSFYCTGDWLHRAMSEAVNAACEAASEESGLKSAVIYGDGNLTIR